MSQSMYLTKRRASASALLPALAYVPPGNTTGTVVAGHDMLEAVSDVCREFGAVLGTAVHADEAHVRVRVATSALSEFLAHLDTVTGRDYAFTRDEVAVEVLHRRGACGLWSGSLSPSPQACACCHLCVCVCVADVAEDGDTASVGSDVDILTLTADALGSPARLPSLRRPQADPPSPGVQPEPLVRPMCTTSLILLVHVVAPCRE